MKVKDVKYVVIEPHMCDASVSWFNSYDEALEYFNERKKNARKHEYCYEAHIAEVKKSVDYVNGR